MEKSGIFIQLSSIFHIDDENIWDEEGKAEKEKKKLMWLLMHEVFFIKKILRSWFWLQAPHYEMVPEF